MSLLSANTLFHFTSKFEWLVSIFENGFIPRLSKEFYQGSELHGESTEGKYVPMVCFCDIPVSQLRNHIELYGGYGIGLEKDWGVIKGLSPVFYLTKESQFLSDFNKIKRDGDKLIFDLIFLIENGRPRGDSDNGSIIVKERSSKDYGYIAEQIYNKFLGLSTLEKYFKPYSGRFIRQDKIYENYCYYNEREWRYNPTFKGNSNDEVPEYVVDTFARFNSNYPSNKQWIREQLEFKIKNGEAEEIIKGFTPDVHPANNYFEKIKDEINKSLTLSPHYHLLFETNYVKYIILKDNAEISNFIDSLKIIQKNQPKKYNNETINYLSTKIITCKQISEDF